MTHQIKFKENGVIDHEYIGYFNSPEKAIEFFKYLSRKKDREIIRVIPVSDEFLLKHKRLAKMPSRIDRAPVEGARWTP